MEKLTRSSLKAFLKRALFAYKNERFASSFLLLGIEFLKASKKANLSFKSPSPKPHINRTGTVFVLPASSLLSQPFQYKSKRREIDSQQGPALTSLGSRDHVLMQTMSGCKGYTCGGGGSMSQTKSREEKKRGLASRGLCDDEGD